MVSSPMSRRSERCPASVPARPIRLEITMTESELVKELRAQASEYRAQLAQLDARCKRAEYKFRCASILNLRLYDWVREKGLKPPRDIGKIQDLDFDQ